MGDERIRTLAQLFDAWLAHIAMLGRSPSTLASYRYKVDAVLIPALGDLEFDELSVLRIDKFYGDLLRGGMSPASVNHHHRILRAALSQGARWGLMATNPARMATPPRSRPVPHAPPTPEQVRRLATAASEGPTPILGAVILVAATTGMRRGELAALRWSAVDLEGATLSVRSSIWQVASRWGEKAPKSNQQRRLHLGDRTIGQFRDLLPATGSDPNHFVFSHRGGPQPYLPEPMTRSFRRVTTALEASTGEAWSFRFHDLRHFTATELFRQGHSARTVANRLGHADVAVTLRTYAHDTDDQARRAADEIERGL